MNKELDYFLKALTNRLNNHRGIFIPISTCIPSKFPAIKTYTQQVWLVDGDYKTLISDVNITSRTVEDSEKNKVQEEVLITTIENILKHYGL